MKLTALPVIVYHFSSANAASCEKSGIPCIPEPPGMLADNEKAKAGVGTVNWLIIAVMIGLLIKFVFMGSINLSGNEYSKSAGPILAVIFLVSVGGIVIWSMRG